ncbi:hypothetical protein FRC01_010686, partial [Tulasnella sp. 417]
LTEAESERWIELVNGKKRTRRDGLRHQAEVEIPTMSTYKTVRLLACRNPASTLVPDRRQRESGGKRECTEGLDHP